MFRSVNAQVHQLESLAGRTIVERIISSAEDMRVVISALQKLKEVEGYITVGQRQHTCISTALANSGELAGCYTPYQ